MSNLRIPIRELGRLRANPKADQQNNARLAVCAESDPCKDRYSGAVGGGVSIVSIVHEGVTHTFDSPIAVTDTAALKAAIENYLQTNTNAQEFNIRVAVTYSGGDLTVEHIGQTALTRLVTDVPSNLDTTRLCTIQATCRYELTAEGALADLSNDGGVTTDTLANSPYAYTGTAVTDAATAATLASDLETALGNLGQSYSAVTVTVNDVSGAFDIVIEAPKGTTLDIDTVNVFSEGSCYEEFVA